MRNYYEVLGVAAGAGDRHIEALSTVWPRPPVVHTGDALAQRRRKESSQAHDTPRGPKMRPKKFMIAPREESLPTQIGGLVRPSETGDLP
jgi:hypothetical protein